MKCMRLGKKSTVKYRTKPIEIEAVRFNDNPLDIKRFVGVVVRATGSFPGFRVDDYAAGEIVAEVYDYLHDTWVGVSHGDFIIKGMKGEFYPCDSQVFEAKYEPAVIARGRRTGGHMILIGGVADGRLIDIQYEIPEFYVAGGCRYQRTSERYSGRVVFQYVR